MGSTTKLRRYQDLIVWQRGMDLACLGRALGKRLQDLREWDLARQVIRSARSIPANIAEGYGLGSLGAYRRHLRIARGSLYELETDLELIVRQSIVPAEEVLQARKTLVEVSRLLAGLIRRLPQSP